MISDYRTRLIEFLKWLIMPQNEREQKLFKDNGCVDYYIEIINKIDDMSIQELTEEINYQLSAYDLKI